MKEQFDLVNFGKNVLIFLSSDSYSPEYVNALDAINASIVEHGTLENVIDMKQNFNEKKLRVNANDGEISQRLELIEKYFIEQIETLIKDEQDQNHTGAELAESLNELLYNGCNSHLAGLKRMIIRNPAIFEKQLV